MPSTRALPTAAVDRLPVDERWLAVLAVQALTLVAYASAASTEVTAVRYLVYPFVWIDLGAWAVLRVDPGPANARRRAAAAIVGVAYLLAMLSVAGFVGRGHASMTGWRVVAAAPGWGPMVAYQGPTIRVFLVPFQVVGYAALAYLLYAALLDATRSALSGVFGLVSCVGCAWTLVAPLVGVAAGASAAGAALYDLSYDLTTLVFLATVALLVRGVGRDPDP